MAMASSRCAAAMTTDGDDDVRDALLNPGFGGERKRGDNGKEGEVLEHGEGEVGLIARLARR